MYRIPKHSPLLLALIWLGALVGSISHSYGQNDVLGGQDTLVLENDRIEDVIESDKPALNFPKSDIPTPSLEDFNYDPLKVFMETDYTPRPPQVKPLEPQGRDRLYHKHDQIAVWALRHSSCISVSQQWSQPR